MRRGEFEFEFGGEELEKFGSQNFGDHIDFGGGEGKTRQKRR
jgi:hypothetical protein